METHNKVAEKTEIYAPYNILPLDPDSANQPIMRFPEVFFLFFIFSEQRFISFFVFSLLCPLGSLT